MADIDAQLHEGSKTVMHKHPTMRAVVQQRASTFAMVNDLEAIDVLKNSRGISWNGKMLHHRADFVISEADDGSLWNKLGSPVTDSGVNNKFNTLTILKKEVGIESTAILLGEPTTSSFVSQSIVGRSVSRLLEAAAPVEDCTVSMSLVHFDQEARDMLHPEHMALDDVDHADGSYMCNATRAVITDCEQARRLVWYAQEQRSKVIRLDGSTTCNTGHLAIIINVDYTEVASKSYCVAYLDLAHDYYGSEEQSANMAEADSLTKLLLAAAEGKSSLPFTTKLQQFVKPFIVGNGYDKLHLGWVLFVPDRPIYMEKLLESIELIKKMKNFPHDMSNRWGILYSREVPVRPRNPPVEASEVLAVLAPTSEQDEREEQEPGISEAELGISHSEENELEGSVPGDKADHTNDQGSWQEEDDEHAVSQIDIAPSAGNSPRESLSDGDNALGHSASRAASITSASSRGPSIDYDDTNQVQDAAKEDVVQEGDKGVTAAIVVASTADEKAVPAAKSKGLLRRAAHKVAKRVKALLA